MINIRRRLLLILIGPILFVLGLVFVLIITLFILFPTLMIFFYIGLPASIVVTELLFLFFVYRFLHQESSSLSELIGYSRQTLNQDIIWALVTFGIFYLTFCAGFLILWLINPPYYTVYISYFRTPLPLSSMLLYSTVVSITAGISEEVIWRGYTITRLEQITQRPWFVIFIAALSWSLFHFDPFKTPVTLMSGLILSLLYIKLRRVFPLIVGHMLFNIIGYAVPFLLFIWLP